MKRNHYFIFLVLFLLPNELFAQEVVTTGEYFFKDLTQNTTTGLVDREAAKELFNEMYLPQLLKKDTDAQSKAADYFEKFYGTLKANYQSKLNKTREAAKAKGFDLSKLEYGGNIDMEATVWKSSESEEAKVKVDKAEGEYHLSSTNYIVTLKQGEHYAFFEVIGLLYNKKYSVVEVKGLVKEIQKSSTRYRVLHDNLTKVFTDCYKDKGLESIAKDGKVLQDDDDAKITKYQTDIEFYRISSNLVWDVEERVKGIKVRRTQYIEGELNSVNHTMEDAMRDAMIALGFMAEEVKTGLQGSKLSGVHTEAIYAPLAGNFKPNEDGSIITKDILFMPNVITAPYFVQIKIEKEKSDLWKSGYVYRTSILVRKVFEF